MRGDAALDGGIGEGDRPQESAAGSAGRVVRADVLAEEEEDENGAPQPGSPGGGGGGIGFPRDGVPWALLRGFDGEHLADAGLCGLLVPCRADLGCGHRGDRRGRGNPDRKTRPADSGKERGGRQEARAAEHLVPCTRGPSAASPKREAIRVMKCAANASGRVVLCMNDDRQTPRWMSRVLIAAAVYNMLWGAFVVLFPHAIFDWCGMKRPDYPQIWQCVGMIVGVYGVAYGAAALDPLRHWPVVLAGLLGKVLGPLGMVQALWTGALPPAFALNCLTNDVIWWVPFALILRQAWRVHRDEPGAERLEEAELLRAVLTEDGRSLADLSAERPQLLVLLRHGGCIFCREAMADLAARRPALEASGIGIVLGHMEPPGGLASEAAARGLRDVPMVSDPGRRLYRGLGLKRGGVRELLSFGVWWRGWQSFRAGFRPGAVRGDPLQMPGIFLLHRGAVVKRLPARTAADRPDYAAACELPREAR